MTAVLEPRPTVPQQRGGAWRLKDRPIGQKLTLGFGMLVLITLIVIGLSFYASADASHTINATTSVRQPAALAATRAQANLLRMFSDVRGYLALGDPVFLEGYRQANLAFEQDLQELQQLADSLGPADQQRLEQLKADYARWQQYPDQLFALRDNQMDREPAYNLLNTTGTELGGSVLIGMNQLIEAQALRDPSQRNNELLRDMANFQSSFAALFSGLRGYVMTRNTLFRYYEYEINRDLNDATWERLSTQRQFLTPEQRQLFNEIDTARSQFFAEVPDAAFAIMQSDGWRLDLELFSTEVTDLTTNMEQLLSDLTESQQALLEQDLARSNESLNRARVQTLLGGLGAVLLGLVLAVLLRQNIAGPVQRLTGVAEQIRAGDLTTVAKVESGDEIGVFAETFNNMTVQLRREKKRANDLLHVVIPIGVALSSERDFQRLLENILVEAMDFCHAQHGALFLREGDDLTCMLLRIGEQSLARGADPQHGIQLPTLELYNRTTREPNQHDTVTYAALTGESVNVTDVATDDRFVRVDFGGAERADMGFTSVLVIPLKNNQQQVIGALGLADARDPDTQQIIAFDANLQQMMESYSSLAVAALEAYIREQALRQEIQELRIEIDEVRRQKQVSEIVDTGLFQDLQARARSLRERRQRNRRGTGDAPDNADSPDSLADPAAQGDPPTNPPDGAA